MTVETVYSDLILVCVCVYVCVCVCVSVCMCVCCVDRSHDFSPPPKSERSHTAFAGLQLNFACGEVAFVLKGRQLLPIIAISITMACHLLRIRFLKARARKGRGGGGGGVVGEVLDWCLPKLY